MALKQVRIVFSFLRQLTAWYCPHSHAAAASLTAGPPAVEQPIDISCRRAHSSKPAAAARGGRTRQTDIRTRGTFTDRAPPVIMRVVPVSTKLDGAVGCQIRTTIQFLFWTIARA